MAIADQGRTLAGLSTLSGTPSQIYSLATSAFHDITSGSNGYAAHSGYDLVTGRGSPIASAVVSGLVGNSTVSTTPTQPPTQTPAPTRYVYVYEWIYWNHRWWLVIIREPAAGAADSDGNIDGAMDQITAAIAGGATHPAPLATVGSSSALATNAEQTAQASHAAQPALLTAWTDTGVGATTHDEQPAATAISAWLGESESTDAPAVDAEDPAAAPTQNAAPATPQEFIYQATGEGSLAAARDVCFGDADWMPEAPAVVAPVVDSLDDRQLHVAGLALALAIGAQWGRTDSDDATSVNGRGDRRTLTRKWNLLDRN